jgi:hypothetical protein
MRRIRGEELGENEALNEVQLAILKREVAGMVDTRRDRETMSSKREEEDLILPKAETPQPLQQPPNPPT